MRPGLFILLAVIGLVGFEAWRLTTPETVRLEQVWTFETPSGPLEIADVIELRQSGAIPYLPGGSVGQSETVGKADVEFSLAGTRYTIRKDPRWLLRLGIEHGTVEPEMTMKGLRNEHATGFIRRLRRSGARVAVPVEALHETTRDLIRIWPTAADLTKVYNGPTWTLPEFESRHPGFRLRTITYTVTQNAVTGAIAE